MNSGRNVRRAVIAATAVCSVFAVGACSGESAGTNDDNVEARANEGDHGGALSEGDRPVDPAPTGAFADLLGRTAVLPTTRGERIDIAYGDQARLRQLAAEDARWEEINGHGAGAIKGLREEMADDLDVDIYSADALYRVGSNAQSLFLFEGNQDTDAITAAAEESGWEPDGDLLTIDETDSDLAIARYTSKLRLYDDSLLAGMRGADMDRLDDGDGTGAEETLLDDDPYATVVDCLGDPVAAVIVDSDDMGEGFAGTDAAEGPVAVGVFEANGTGPVQTVVCALSEDPVALADGIVNDVGNEPVNPGLVEDPLSERISNVDVSYDGDLVKAIFDLSEDADADSVMDLTTYPGLPGFRGNEGR